jgi:integrase
MRRASVVGSQARAAARIELEALGWLECCHGGGRAAWVRVHDLRHTAASVWLAARADPEVVQRVLGHATASMTMDLYGHLMDANLWEAARANGGILGASEPVERPDEDADDTKADESAW